MAVHNDLGAWGERVIAQQLGQVGQVQRGQTADLRLAGIEIEVKTARPSRYNGRNLGYHSACIAPGGGACVRRCWCVSVWSRARWW